MEKSMLMMPYHMESFFSWQECGYFVPTHAWADFHGASDSM